MSEEAKVPMFRAPEKKKAVHPPILVIHGPPGVGKSSLAASAPDALFLFTENGQRDLEVATITDKPFETLADFIAGLTFVGMGLRDGTITNVKTLVIDTLDHLELLVQAAVTDVYRHRAAADGFDEVAVRKITSFNEIPAKYNFEKWSEIDAQWQKVWGLVTRLRDRGLAVVGLCHSHLRQIDDPATDAPYERHELKLDPKRAQKYWVDNADCVGFIHYPTVYDSNTRRTSIAKHPQLSFERSAAWMSKPNFGLTHHKLDKKESGFMDALGEKVPFYAQFNKPAPQAETKAATKKGMAAK